MQVCQTSIVYGNISRKMPTPEHLHVTPYTQTHTRRGTWTRRCICPYRPALAAAPGACVCVQWTPACADAQGACTTALRCLGGLSRAGEGVPRGSPQAPTRFCAPLLPLVLTLPLCPAAPPWGSSTHQERAAEAAQCLRTPTVVAVPLQLSSSRAAMVAQCSYASPARAVLHLHPSSTSPSPPYPAGWPAPPSHAPVTTSTPGTTPPRTPMSRRARTTRCAPPPPRRPPCRWCPLAGSFAATRPWRQVTTPRMRRACAPPPYAMCMPLLVAPHPSRLVTTPPNTYTGTGTGTRTHTHTHKHTHTGTRARAHTHTHKRPCRHADVHERPGPSGLGHVPLQASRGPSACHGKVGSTNVAGSEYSTNINRGNVGHLGPPRAI